MKVKKHLIRVACLILLLLSGANFSFSQQTKNQLGDYFNGLRAGKNSKLPEFTQKNAEEALESVYLFYSDTVSKIRAAAYYITKRIGVNSTSTALRKKAVAMLLTTCKDKDSGNSGISYEYLTQFQKTDFEPGSIESLKKLLQIGNPHLDVALKLAGFLEITDFRSKISEMISAEKASKQVKWAAHLALARMGFDDEVNYCLERCKRIPVNDNVVYNLLPDLIYTRQKVVFDHLVQILNSNEKNCSSPNPDSEQKIYCGYRVMELLAPAVKNFPLQLGPDGDIETSNYENALKISRDWFKDTDYQIDNSRF